MKYDLLLKGARAIGIFGRKEEPTDIAVNGDRIAGVEDRIPSESAKQVMDLEGCYISPGLIDMHCHIYQTLPRRPEALSCIDPDAHMPQNGVTTAVDAGTAGCRDFFSFKEEVIDRSQTRILAFINIASGGMVSIPAESEPVSLHPRIAAEIANAFPDVVGGIKTAHYLPAGPFSEARPPWASVDSAIDAADRCGKPAMFDVWPVDGVRTYPDLLLKKMRSGDIHTHVFAGHIPSSGKDGKIESYMYKARKRGVIFDLGHGAGSFVFNRAVPAIAQGFYPDTISTDLYLNNVAGPSIGLTHVMSKLLCLGMPFDKIIEAVTSRPAAVLGHPELGILKTGGGADIAVLKIRRGKFGFADNEGVSHSGEALVECILTLRNGKILYNPFGLGLSPWNQPTQEPACAGEASTKLDPHCVMKARERWR